MKRVLLTGMSGTGKSTVIGELTARGYRAADADADGYSEWVAAEGNPTGANEGRDWRWREDRVRAFLEGEAEAGGVLFLSGCADNMAGFFPRFDHIILLSAPPAVLLERLATRSNNPYGKRPEEARQVLENLRAVEPRLRRVAGHEIDVSAPLEEVVAQVLHIVLKKEPHG